jgi:hypothetical protein
MIMPGDGTTDPCNENVYTPTVVGVPEIVPVAAFSVTPGGKLPKISR